MTRTIQIALMWSVLFVLGCSPKNKIDPEQTSVGEPGAPSAAKAECRVVQPKSEAAPKLGLPKAERVFVVDLDGDGYHEFLGAHRETLWAFGVSDTGAPIRIWESQGEGAVQRVVVGDVGEGRRLYVGRGVGRGLLGAQLTIQSLVPMTGKASTVWQRKGERNEVAHLSIADVNRDGRSELAVAHFKTKYMVETMRWRPGSEPESTGVMRMASSAVYGDVNGEGGVDEVLGRVYGDARGLPGDLKVNLGNGHVTVPTENGVRGLVIAQLENDERPHLYFADGWVANYGKEAKAIAKRASWGKNGFETEQIGGSPEDFTFFELLALDVDNDCHLELLGRGNKNLVVFQQEAGRWQSYVAASYQPVINVAVGRGGDGYWRVLVPGEVETVATLLKKRP